jgi:hypothetical protein
MVKQRVAKMNAYLRRAADCCGLRDWSVEMEDGSRELKDRDGDELYAEVTMSEDRTASVIFAEDFWGFPPDKQRSIVVHELCHPHCRRLRTLGEDLAATAPVPFRKILEAAIEDADEHATEWMAKLLAPNVPLPPKF